MTWPQFELDTALERDVLERALPLPGLIADGRTATAVLDPAMNQAQIGIHVVETLGATASGCIEILAIRPLLMGAAWKVLDLMLEAALAADGVLPQGRWTIAKKVSHARSGTGRPVSIPADCWRALMITYAETEQLRHSLVHRRAYTEADGSLTGHSAERAPLRALTVQEQEALARAALRATEMLTGSASGRRAESDLASHLAALANLHGVRFSADRIESIPRLTVIVDAVPGGSDAFVLDLPYIRARQPFRSAPYTDLIVQIRDRPGTSLRGALEDAPDEVLVIDLNAPPDWLR